jgi:hypothetical protein
MIGLANAVALSGGESEGQTQTARLDPSHREMRAVFVRYGR